jgi:hypothetical protein
MEFYEPNETLDFNSKHTLKYTFQYEEAISEIVTSVKGNVCGKNVMDIDFDCITAPRDNYTNKKHCVFEEDLNLPTNYIDSLIFYNKNSGESFKLQIEECEDYLVKVEIIDYKP